MTMPDSPTPGRDPGSVGELPAFEQVSDDGSCYLGTLDGAQKKHGFGRYMWADGSMYEGEWSKNKFHGIGKLSYADGGEYTGEWIEDRKNGHGKMRYCGYHVILFVCDL